MNKEEPYRDQAERLRQRIEKINEETQIEESDSLPPRERVHRQKKKKTKFKLKFKYPIIQLLVIIFVLLPLIYLCSISYLEGKDNKRVTKTTGDSFGSEAINLNNTKKDGTNIDKTKENGEKKQQEDSSTGTTDKSSESTDNTEKTDPPGQSTNQTEGSSKDQNTEKNNSDTNTTTTTQPAQQNNSEKTNTSPTKPAEKTTKVVYHTVKKQETLFRIAKIYYKSSDGIDIIKKANHLKSDQISAGQVLKIPLEK